MKIHMQNEIDRLKEMIIALAAAAEDSLQRALRSVNNLDVRLAAEVTDGDEAIDRDEVRIEEECLKILALYQPVAGDLRYVITLLKVNSEIERVGDLAAAIAARTPDLAVLPPPNEPIDFADMVVEVRSMLKNALDSLIYRNSLAAVEVISRDDTVDRMHVETIGRLRELMAHYPADIPYYLNMLTVSRSLERIADSATNIAEDVIYLEQGRIVRHSH